MSPFGLTVDRFLDQISPDDALNFVPAEMRDLIDRLGGEGSDRSGVNEIAKAMVDFVVVLENARHRTSVIGLLDESQRGQLARRLGISAAEVADPAHFDWTVEKLVELKRFFGLGGVARPSDQRSPRSQIQPRFGLFDHQLVAAKRLIRFFEEGSIRALLHFPTGVGKTRTAMHVVCGVLSRHKPCVVVWMASGKELLEQAEEAFIEAWEHLGNRSLELLTMWDDASPDLSSFEDGLLIVGLQKGSAYYRQDELWAKRLSAHTRLVVFDEAHQSLAPTYKRLTEDLLYHPPCGLLGLSATPGRTWADIDEDRRLAEMYMENKVSLEIEGHENPVSYLMNEGYLSRPEFRTLHAQPGLALTDADRNTIEQSLDLPEGILDGLSMSHQYLLAVLDAVKSLIDGGHRRVLVFAASVKHAKFVSGILASRGLSARVVTGETPAQERRRAIEQFRGASNEPMVLVNFGVLTTGFDAPQISAAVIARPTRSLVLYSQMVGRAIRGPKAGGTDECTIITGVDPALQGFGDVADAFENWEDVWC